MPRVRFEVHLNGCRLCVAGLDRRGMLGVDIRSDHGIHVDESKYPPSPPPGEENTLCAYAFPVDDMSWWWSELPIAPGDEITIRVLPDGPFDPPGRIDEPEDEG